MIKAKKSLGQNFLIDQNIIKKITKIINIKNKRILEIGPGTGNLTNEILENDPSGVLVIEKDSNLIKLLKDKFNSKIQIINKDILEVEEKTLSNKTLTVFGNLPYNISTEILIKWILGISKKKVWFDYLVLMFQKEVADRIVSNYNTKNYGRLSILSNWRLNVKKICDIGPNSFYPKPKVESTLLLFEPKKIFIEFIDSKNLEKITRVFFMHRRKMIKKPFFKLFNGNLNLAIKMGINLNLRPQNLDLKTYFQLTKEYEKLIS
jgi:16S rRNA (adenine1518-N6/adenine1519-N6)-dimethyltransferase